MKQLNDYIIEKANFLVKKHLTNSNKNKEDQNEILEYVCKLLGVEIDNALTDTDIYTKWRITGGNYPFPSNMITKLQNKYGKENYGVGKNKVRVQICRDDESSYLIWYKDALPIQIRWVNWKEKYIIKFNQELPDKNYDEFPK